MYQVSNDYLTAIHKAVQSGYISGTVGGVTFDASDVLLGSASISNQCANPTDVKLGTAAVGTLKITFCNKILVHRGTWSKKVIRVYWNQLIDETTEPKTYETIPCGVFTISEVNHAAEGVVVTAYDNMAKFDTELQLSTTDGTPYNLAKLLCNQVGVTFGMTKAEVEALPNGTETLSLYPDNDCKTYRDVLSWLALTLGSFATIDRDGALVFRTYTDTPVISFNAYERISGGSFSDFVSYYTQINVEDLAEETSYTEMLPGNTGLVMDIGANPFNQYGLTATKRDIRLAILHSLEKLKYTPFSTTLLGNPCFDLGDVITFVGGIAGTSSLCCVMGYTYIFNRTFAVSGYGKNPATLGAESATDKAIEGAKSNSKTNELTFLKYVNADDQIVYFGYEMEDLHYAEKTLLNTFTVEALKDTNVEVDICYKPTELQEYNLTGDLPTYLFIGSILELDGVIIDTSIDYRFFDYNGVSGGLSRTFCWKLGDYPPMATYEHHKTILNIAAGSRHNLKVYSLAFLRTHPNNMSGWTTDMASFKLAAGDVEIVVKGQGLAQDERFNGLIVVADNLTPYVIHGLKVSDLSDQVSVDLLTNSVTSLSDQINEPYEIDVIVPPSLSEAVNITMTKLAFNLITEDGEYNIVTEDEDYNIITE